MQCVNEVHRDGQVGLYYIFFGLKFSLITAMEFWTFGSFWNFWTFETFWTLETFGTIRKFGLMAKMAEKNISLKSL